MTRGSWRRNILAATDHYASAAPAQASSIEFHGEPPGILSTLLRQSPSVASARVANVVHARLDKTVRD